MCEVIIKEQWVKYLEENTIVTNKQPGKEGHVLLLSFDTRESNRWS